MARKGASNKSMDTSAAQLSDLLCCSADLEHYLREFILSGGREITFLLSGKTGVGKSHLTNALIGQELAEEGEELDPQTDDVSHFPDGYQHNLLYSQTCHLMIFLDLFYPIFFSAFILKPSPILWFIMVYSCLNSLIDHRRLLLLHGGKTSPTHDCTLAPPKGISFFLESLIAESSLSVTHTSIFQFKILNSALFL